ncbi:efflux RND transporter periplasmic adaptor subunit [Sphingomonas oligophenolica]|uniref:Efflux RND transporter periplasmic adaptor subunit n=1 Tax=Sphingomonas oligophenolica TaxID=301154 RepID=A0ABU9Y3E3_9SPHN
MFDHHIEALPAMPGLSKSKQFRVLGWAALAILLTFGLVTLIHWISTPTPAAPEVLPPGAFRATPDELAQLRIETVRYGPDPGQISATGTISVDEDHSTPIVLPYSGQVGEVLVQAGQHVERGQPLLKIASSDFVEARNTLFAAAAQRASAIAQLKTVSENEKRQAAIYQTAGGALKDFRQAQTDLVAAQSAVRSADAALGAARDKLALLGKTPAEVKRLEAAGEIAGIYAETTFHAPVSGIVAGRNVAPGQYVSAGGDKPLLTIADLSRVWLIAQIAESDAASVHVGDPVEVTTPAFPGRVFHAVIDNIGAALDPTSHRLPVRATVTNADLALKPDMFASFAIQRHRGSSAVLVPAAAVIHEGDSARVWVLGKSGLLFSRNVVVTDSVGGWDKIGAGLRPGEHIVTAGAIFVNEAGLAA